jgi:hypothetical protein
MNLWKRFLRWRLERQHPNLSRAFTLKHERTKVRETYVVCLECGAEFEYDLGSMRITGKQIRRPIEAPDYVAMERAWQDEARRESNAESIAFVDAMRSYDFEPSFDLDKDQVPKAEPSRNNVSAILRGLREPTWKSGAPKTKAQRYR